MTMLEILENMKKEKKDKNREREEESIVEANRIKISWELTRICKEYIRNERTHRDQLKELKELENKKRERSSEEETRDVQRKAHRKEFDSKKSKDW